jgi:hypothetical protein
MRRSTDPWSEPPRPRDSNARPVLWTIGSGLDLLKRLVNQSRRDLVALNVRQLLKLTTDLRWLEA